MGRSRHSGAIAAQKQVFENGDVRITADATMFARVLSDLENAIDAPGPDVMELAGEDIVDGIQEEFETSGHGKWAPHADSTLKSRRGSMAQLLVDSGRMRGSVDANAIEAGDSWVSVASDVDYQVFHVSDEPRFKIPLRDFYDIDQKYLELASETVLDGVLKEAGFR